MDPAQIKWCAAETLATLHTTSIPLQIRALKEFQATGELHPLRAQQNIPLWMQLYMLALGQYNIAVVLLKELEGTDPQAREALKGLSIMDQPDESKDDLVKANRMHVAAERALRVLRPDHPFQIFSAGDIS